MFLACVEIAAFPSNPCEEHRVLEVVFDDLEPAKVWAAEESSRRGDATGNAAVFETSGPLMVLAWERAQSLSSSQFIGADEAARALYVA